MERLTFLPEERHANPTRLRESDLAWMTRAANSHLSLLPWLNDCLLAGWFGKTSPAFCQLTEEGILEPSSRRWANAGMGGPTESLTLSFSESPKNAAASSLSDILETEGAQERCYLSQKAATGILRRDDARGRKLPERLRRALETAVITYPPKADT